MDAHIPPAGAGPHEEHRRGAVSRAADSNDPTDEAEHGHDRDPAVSGPHGGHDRYGRFDYRYWRCEACGLETTQDISDGCPRCARVARRARGNEDDA
jgi:rubrerythrin